MSSTSTVPTPTCLDSATASKVIDGYGMAMYVNHCCDPNCETEEDEEGRVWIAAMRDIDAGEELTYDYFLYDGEGDAPCTCGTRKLSWNDVFKKGNAQTPKPDSGEFEEDPVAQEIRARSTRVSR